MAVRVRLYAPETAVAVISYDSALNTLLVAGDQTAYFPIGSVVRVGGSTGGTGINAFHTVSNVSYSTPNTTITLATNFTGTPTGGSIYFADYIDFLETDLAYVDPVYPDTANHAVDRWKRRRKVITASNSTRFPDGVELDICANDLNKVSGLFAQRLTAFIRAYCLTLYGTLILMTEQVGADSAGTAFTERRAYTVTLDETPPFLFGTQNFIGESPERMTFGFNCTADGVPASIESWDYTPTSRPT